MNFTMSWLCALFFALCLLLCLINQLSLILVFCLLQRLTYIVLFSFIKYNIKENWG